jgi:cytochrome P450
VDVSIDMTRVTFEIITETLFGRPSALDFDAFGDTLIRYSQSLTTRAVLSFARMPEWTPFPGRWKAARARDDMLRLIRAPVRDRGGPAPSGLFDMLANAEDSETGRRQTEDEFVNNIATFLNAGHETTAVALTWTLWLLSKDLQAQERLAEEAARVLGEAPLEARHIDELVFTRQVIQEAMRLYPPAPALARRPLKKMDFGGEAVSPRTQITVAIYPLHRNRGLWVEPDAFDPERFTPEQVKARPRHAYMPFGAGPRICIGATFSLIEATAVLAELVRAYRFSAMPGYRPQILGHVTMRPHEGMPLFITPRRTGRRRTPSETAEAA